MLWCLFTFGLIWDYVGSFGARCGKLMSIRWEVKPDFKTDGQSLMKLTNLHLLLINTPRAVSAKLFWKAMLEYLIDGL